MGNKNIVKEYDKLEGFVKEKKEVVSIVEDVRALPLNSFSKGVIHGDMQTKHVLKNLAGKYCILDFGCMSFDAKVVEISTFLAWFCFSEKNWESQSDIYKKILSMYLKRHPLTHDEISSIPILIRAAYASYYLQTSQLIVNGDDSQETREWNSLAYKLLQRSTSFTL